MHKRTCEDGMDAGQLRRERYKQDRRKAAAETHGDAWSGLCARVPSPGVTKRQVDAEIARWMAKKGN